MALKISGPRLNPCLLTSPVYVPLFHISERAPELCEVVLHSEYECACERERLALWRRAKERSESEDAALRACLSKEVVEEGRPPREREGTCETRPRGTKNDDGVGRLNDGRFGTGAREVHGMRMQDEESNGGPTKRGGGGGEGHLGFGDVDAKRDGHTDRSIGDGWKRGTNGPQTSRRKVERSR